MKYEASNQKRSSPKTPKIKDSKIKDPKIKDQKIKDWKIKDPKIKNRKIKDWDIKDWSPVYTTLNFWYGTDKIGTRTTFFGSWITYLGSPRTKKVVRTVPKIERSVNGAWKSKTQKSQNQKPKRGGGCSPKGKGAQSFEFTPPPRPDIARCVRGFTFEY
jgi:hypothetical protein